MPLHIKDVFFEGNLPGGGNAIDENEIPVYHNGELVSSAKLGSSHNVPAYTFELSDDLSAAISLGRKDTRFLTSDTPSPQGWYRITAIEIFNKRISS